MGAYQIIAREEGIAGLWTGVGPNIGRNAIINAAELASYDQVKQTLLASGYFRDDALCHIFSARAPRRAFHALPPRRRGTLT